MNQRKCEGDCITTHGKHRGDVVPVIVRDEGNRAYQFNYCLNAIEEDERRGFDVNVIPAAIRIVPKYLGPNGPTGHGDICHSDADPGL